MKDNHPASATKVTFKPIGLPKVKYYFWTDGKSYYWSAQGNSGKEDTLEAAMRAAREYILLGINGRKSHGEYRGLFNGGGQQSS